MEKPRRTEIQKIEARLAEAKDAVKLLRPPYVMVNAASAEQMGIQSGWYRWSSRRGKYECFCGLDVARSVDRRRIAAAASRHEVEKARLERLAGEIEAELFKEREKNEQIQKNQALWW